MSTPAGYLPFGADQSVGTTRLPTTAGVPITVAPNSAISFWTTGPAKTGGTAITDIIEADGVTAATFVTSNPDGSTPRYFLRVSSAWADAGGSTRVQVFCDPTAAYVATLAERQRNPLRTYLTGLKSSLSSPVYTISSIGAGTSITNPATVDINDTTKFRVEGCSGFGFFGGGYYGLSLAGVGSVDFPTTTVETMMLGRYADFILDAARGFFVEVDGARLRDLPDVTPVTAGNYRVQVDCGTVGIHHVRVGANAIWSGVTYDSTVGTLWAPDSPLPLVELYIGDSWCQGYGALNTAVAYSPNGAAANCAQLLGTQIINAGQDGTGYTVNPTPGTQSTFPARVPLLLGEGFTPARVIVLGSVNDYNASAAPSAVQAAATATYAALATAWPLAEVHVFGMQPLPANVALSAYIAIDNAIATAAAAAPNVKSFTSMLGWSIPTNLVTSDANHLLMAGYKLLASRMAACVTAATAI